MFTAMLTLGATLLMVAEPVAKVPAPVAREMADAIIAANKALGLESWEAQGAKPCVDRGGEGAGSKDVSGPDTRACTDTVITAKAFPALGKSYVLAILMAPIGPVTVMALGTGDAAGWGAYSCDPGRKCPPTKLSATTKWGKRLVDRQLKACGQATTLWFPVEQRLCDGVSAPVEGAPAAPPAPPKTDGGGGPTTPPPAAPPAPTPR